MEVVCKICLIYIYIARRSVPRINKIDENKRFIRVHKKQLPMRKLWRLRRMSFIFIRVLYLFREKENIYIYI